MNAIRATRADVVLMSAGPAPLAENALSPVATEVLAEAACPVLLEWPVTAPVNQARAHPVCCAVEFDRGEEAVLREAAWAAARMQAPLKLVCALVPGGANMALLFDPAERDREIARVTFAHGRPARPLRAGAGVHVGVGLPVSVFSRAIRATAPRCWSPVAPTKPCWRRNRSVPCSTCRPPDACGPDGPKQHGPVVFAAGRTGVMVPPRRRHKLRDQIAGALKVIMLSGGLLGGLWLLQMIARD